MKKLTNLLAAATVAVAILFGTSAKAQTSGTDSQNNWRLGVGIEPGVPVGNSISNYSNFELGGTARLQYDIKGNVSVMLTTGYYNFFAKNSGDKSLGLVPVKLGAKVFIAPSWYFSGEAGAGFETTTGYTGRKDTKLLLSPGFGYAANNGLDVGVRYENFSGKDNNYGLIGLRVAYGFKL